MRMEVRRAIRAVLRAAPQLPMRSLSVASAGQREAEVLRVLREQVREPISDRDIVSVGALQHARATPDGDVSVTLDLFAHKHPDESQIVRRCEEALSTLPWARSSAVHLSRRPPRSSFAKRDSALGRVEHVLAVSSCKGGVGKSTVAVNLALAMAGQGLAVGLLDADIYGPSLPYMLIPDSYDVQTAPSDNGRVLPLTAHGLRCMSFGFVAPSSSAGGRGRESAIMRGPMASKVLNQLLLSTEWGELDFLIVDMPPGTGDLQLTLGQSVTLAGAVLVTTPHTLSVADLVKGAAMFGDMRVPPLAIVENMAYFRCDAGKKYQLFGPSGEQYLRRSVATLASPGAADGLLKCPHFSVPILRGAAIPDEEEDGTMGSVYGEGTAGSEDGVGIDVALPAVLRDPLSEEARVFSSLANAVRRQLLRGQIEAQLLPSVTYIKHKGILLRYFTATSASEHLIPCEVLRLRDPQSGLPRDHFHGVPLVADDHVAPASVEPKGAYGVAIVWADAGRTSDIYSFDALRTVAMSLPSSEQR